MPSTPFWTRSSITPATPSGGGRFDSEHQERLTLLVAYFDIDRGIGLFEQSPNDLEIQVIDCADQRAGGIRALCKE
jgi:hypothetical protein